MGGACSLEKDTIHGVCKKKSSPNVKANSSK
jgi:hypothetical protein